MFLGLNSKGLQKSSGEEKESCSLVFPSSTKREFRHLHVVVVQRRQRKVQKNVMHVQICCFANLRPCPHASVSFENATFSLRILLQSTRIR